MAEQKQNTPEEYGRSPVIRTLNRGLTVVDDAILVLVACGIIAVAWFLMMEAITDFILYTQHSISHIISDLMFVLIVMELLRQVLRQLNRHTFSLNPFIFIGVIASIRGILLTQMKIGMGEAEWESGVIILAVHAAIILVLITSLYIYSKGRPKDER